MRRYKLLRFLYGIAAVFICAALLISALIATAASMLWQAGGSVDGEASETVADAGKPPDAVVPENTSLDLICDPGGAFALEFYDSLYFNEFTENGETSADGGYTIITRDLSAASIYDFYNETKYVPDADALLTGFELSGGAVYTSLSVNPEPLVLIIHTHGTEGFAASGATYYSADSLPRSTDITENIVAVGRAMRDTFITNGIPALHCEIMHDRDSYNDSYRNSLATVLAYLDKYPSIKYVFDVHRDAILGDGTMTKCVCDIGGVSSAQVMFVVGTDAGGANYPDWQKNLTFALEAQSLAAERYPGLMRPINLRRASFNAQYAQHGLLIEVGSCANTLEEAKAAGAAVAEVLSELINRGY